MKSTSNVSPSVRKIMMGLVIFLFMNASLTSMAQQDTTTFKNLIKVNLTNPMIFGYKSIIFEYERVLKNNQSFSIGLGRSFYGILASDQLDSIRTVHGGSSKDIGFHISGDYRWYLKKENKYAAPHGLYIGPYCSYNYFNRTSDWVMNTQNFKGTATMDMTINIGTIGGELGYQFLFGKTKRWALDMVLFGPGIAHYSFKTSFKTDLSAEAENELLKKLNDMLHEKFPGMNRIIDGDGIQRNGTSNTTDAGYRYMIMFGYRF